MTRVRASVPSPAGLAQLRNLEAADIPWIVRYWHESGEAHLDFLGVDRSRLGMPDDTYRRFHRAIPSGDPEQPNIAFAIAIDGEFAGYTLLNRYGRATNYSHWHVTDPAWRARGLSTALYPHRIGIYFDVTTMERLIHQMRTRNLAVNRMLDKYVTVAETAFIEQPNGVAKPGEFHIRYVHRADIPFRFDIAAQIAPEKT